MKARLKFAVIVTCAAAGVKFFFKQMDKAQPIPEDLLIREFPKT